mmetsp:Transcript_38881/g.82737  ORF Transcript_38881/g.82737 Transcript_38881/m.82737 type:complete len:319 (-) Transcript_38881:945-1901(-)
MGNDLGGCHLGCRRYLLPHRRARRARRTAAHSRMTSGRPFLIHLEARGGASGIAAVPIKGGHIVVRVGLRATHRQDAFHHIAGHSQRTLSQVLPGAALGLGLLRLHLLSELLIGLAHHLPDVCSIELGVGSLLLRGCVGRQHLHLQRVQEMAQELLGPFEVSRGLQLPLAARLEVRVRGVPRARVGEHNRPHILAGDEGPLSKGEQVVSVACGALREQEQRPVAGPPRRAVFLDGLHRSLPGGRVAAVYLDHPDFLGEEPKDGRLRHACHRDDLGRPENHGKHRAVEVAHVIGHDNGRRLHVLHVLNILPTRQGLIGH